MGWLHRNLPWVLLALVVVTSLLVVGTLGAGLALLLGGLLSGASVGATLSTFAMVLGAVTLLGVLDVALVVALLVTAVRRASLPRSERLADWSGRAERLVPPLRRFELSDRFAPTVEERKRRLERRYVEGDLSEAEFERRLAALLEEGAADEREPVDPPADLAGRAGPAADARTRQRVDDVRTGEVATREDVGGEPAPDAGDRERDPDRDLDRERDDGRVRERDA